MNKKKACIDSLSVQLDKDGQEPLSKLPRLASTETDKFRDIKEQFSSVTDHTVSDTEAKISERLGTTDSISSTEQPNSAAIKSDDSKKLSYLNQDIFNAEVTKQLHDAFISGSEFVNDQTNVKLSSEPFRHCILQNLIAKEDYVTDLESALCDLPLRGKNNDLYKFSQSRDLNHSKSSTISTFRTLCNSIRSLVSAITDIPLNSKVDLFCSQYKYTDVLLCHDDELEERRVAFIYYLVPENWSADDGGTLDLFDCDQLGQPSVVSKSIVPQRNSFLFFEVSPVSFHQVAEVLSEDKTRLSISGWFHGPQISRPEPYVDMLSPAIAYGSIEEQVFYSWFNPLYLAPDVQSDIRKRFEEDSEIELADFLQEAKYNELVSALKDSAMEWQLLGPPNKRKYHASVERSRLPPIVAEYLRVIQSDAVFLVLSNLTGLKLHSLAPVSEDEGGASLNGPDCSNGDDESHSNPRCRSEVRKWEHGCYTLAHDTDPEMYEFSLDTMLYIDCAKEWSYEMGGHTSYIAKGEEEELLSIDPIGNSLALVYRDKGTMRFVKHLNHRVTKLEPSQFFEINTVYYE